MRDGFTPQVSADRVLVLGQTGRRKVDSHE